LVLVYIPPPLYCEPHPLDYFPASLELSVSALSHRSVCQAGAAMFRLGRANQDAITASAPPHPDGSENGWGESHQSKEGRWLFAAAEKAMLWKAPRLRRARRARLLTPETGALVEHSAHQPHRGFAGPAAASLSDAN